MFEVTGKLSRQDVQKDNDAKSPRTQHHAANQQVFPMSVNSISKDSEQAAEEEKK